MDKKYFLMLLDSISYFRSVFCGTLKDVSKWDLLPKQFPELGNLSKLILSWQWPKLDYLENFQTFLFFLLVYFKNVCYLAKLSFLSFYPHKKVVSLHLWVYLKYTCFQDWLHSMAILYINSYKHFFNAVKWIRLSSQNIGTLYRNHASRQLLLFADFGVDSGNQTSNGCDFTYDSKYAKNGSFQSPNFNGYYPRDMECTYYFKGSEAYLKINFTHFNVPGTQE